jgi:Tol biopolymer transport system component
VTLSPAGNSVVFLGTGSGKRQLYLRDLATQEAKPIAGTEGAFCTPFFSPDGEWIGFVADGKLKKVSVNGGAAVILTSIAGINGASWEIEDTIILASGAPRGLLKVPATGGNPEPITTPDTATGERSHRWPQVLPGGNKVLFAATVGENIDDSRIVAQDLRTGERRTLVQGGTFPHYVPTGHIVYVQKGTLMAVAFDAEKMDVSGSPLPVGENVAESGQGAAQYGLSHLGSFVYVPGGAAADQGQLVWVDRKGMEQPLDAPMNVYTSGGRFSPEGGRIALEVQGATLTTWIYDLSRNTMTRFFYEAGGESPVWTPDSTRIAFYSSLAGTRGLFWKPAGGSGAEERLTLTEVRTQPFSFSPDGRFLAFVEQNSSTGWDIGILPLEGERKPQTFLRTPFNESTPMVSPDGRWLAYTSNESGRYEIYVQPFPAPGEKVQISSSGGFDPVWARTGRELFFRTGNKMMAVPFQTGARFVAGKPAELFEGPYRTQFAPVPSGSYDVTPDGQRFLMIKTAAARATQISVVVNWFEDLKRKFR